MTKRRWVRRRRTIEEILVEHPDVPEIAAQLRAVAVQHEASTDHAPDSLSLPRLNR